MTRKERTWGQNRNLMMMPPPNTPYLVMRLIMIATLSVLVAGCNSGKRLTKANVDQVAEGMSKKQVESILGQPTTIDTKDFVVMKKTTYVYDQGKESVTIV